MELEGAVKQLFEVCREYCKEVIQENTIERNKEYKRRLEDLESIWKLHNQRMMELITKAKSKCDSNIEKLTEWKTS